MPGLLDSKLTRPLDPSLKGNDTLAQASLLQLMNDPRVADPNMSAADKLEQNQAAHMLAETLGGPSAEEQAAQVAANPHLKGRKGPGKPPAPAVDGQPVVSPIAESAAQYIPPAGLSVPSATVSSTISASASALQASPVSKIFFTGRSGVGKSFLVGLVGARVLEFQMPLGLVWTGPVPSADVVARLIAWANGVFNPTYPNNTERVAFVQLARMLFDLPEFGRENFLVKHLISEAAHVDSGIVAVTDVQTAAEFKLLQEAGFRHFHVSASQTTMASRNKRQRDEALAAHLDGQASGLMQREPQGDKKPVVWSDPITASPCARFYTPEEFKSLLVVPVAPPIAGVDL